MLQHVTQSGCPKAIFKWYELPVRKFRFTDWYYERLRLENLANETKVQWRRLFEQILNPLAVSIIGGIVSGMLVIRFSGSRAGKKGDESGMPADQDSCRQ